MTRPSRGICFANVGIKRALLPLGKREPRGNAMTVPKTDDELGLPPGAFAKIDAEDDEYFYEEPRLVLHIDHGAITALTRFYRRVLPKGGVLLDLMSSWVSHLPPEAEYGEVIGHGMNATELAANPRLSRWF